MKNLDAILSRVQKTYKGKWKISEELRIKDCKQQKEWMRIVDLNTKS
jgi:hypothetical protein